MTTRVIARELPGDEPPAVYWRDVDDCGNLTWGDLDMTPVQFASEADAQRAYDAARASVRPNFSAQWTVPTATAVVR